MIHRRAAGPGPRTVAPHRVNHSHGRIGPPLLAALAVVAVVAAACGTSTGSPTAPAGSTVPSSAPVIGPAAPSGSAGPAAAGSTKPDASPPRWPGTTVLAVIALGGADGEIREAGDDLQAAAASQDLKAMWGAADGLATMINGLMPNIDRLEVYEVDEPLTQQWKQVAALYRKAFPELLAGAKQLRDSITSGDANGIVAGSQAIAQGLTDYAPIRQQIAALVEQAILQQRLLVE